MLTDHNVSFKLLLDNNYISWRELGESDFFFAVAFKSLKTFSLLEQNRVESEGIYRCRSSARIHFE